MVYKLGRSRSSVSSHGHMVQYHGFGFETELFDTERGQRVDTVDIDALQLGAHGLHTHQRHIGDFETVCDGQHFELVADGSKNQIECVVRHLI